MSARCFQPAIARAVIQNEC
uniref:Uncharacterized protein n=1 Tax=Anguilla anguilla TaxID=7936 RepID=A0A0E9QCR3_ANGAN